MTEMIVLEGLTKRFGPLLAVDDVSMTVRRGELLGFLGPNGAGKSTTMKMIAGFMEPTAGTAIVCGHDVTREPVAVKRRIGYLPEGAPTYGDMTPNSYLHFVAEARGFDGKERRRRVGRAVEMVSLEAVLYQPIDTLSKGYKRRVGLAQAILHDPEVLILDEPTDGLDPNQKRHARELIREMSRDKAIVISTHILEEVEAVCTRAVVIAGGRLRADGTPEALRARAPDRNAVLLTVGALQIDLARKVAREVPAVDRIETVPAADGTVRMRVFPKDGAVIAPELGARLRDRQVTVEEMVVERGALDDAFWQITMGDISGKVKTRGGRHA